MSTETLDPPATEAANSFSFDAAIEAAMMGYPESPPEETTPAAPAAAPEPKPDATPAEAKPPIDDPAPKPGSFKALKMEGERKISELRAEHQAKTAEYETKLAEANGKAVDVSEINKGWEEKLSASEALKAAHEAKATELERQVVGQYETPYSLEVDPDAMPVLERIKNTRNVLDMAVNSAATSLGEDTRSVELIASNRTLFANVIGALSNGMTPDIVHAQSLVDGLKKVGVTVATEEARAVVRDLKSVLPHLYEFNKAQEMLKHIVATNEPRWNDMQLARSEAKRRQYAAMAEVAEDAAEGEDAVVARILKEDPQENATIRSEADKIATAMVGPRPGKATSENIAATKQFMEQTAIRAAKIPVLVNAYNKAKAENELLSAEVAALKARIAKESNVVPSSAYIESTPVTGKVNFDARLAELYPNR